MAQQTPADQAQDAARRAGQNIQQGAQRTGQAIQQGADRIASATQQSAELSPADASEIRQTLRETTDAALTKGGFDDTIERFSDADRARLARDNFVKQDHQVLDGRVAQFQKDWQGKYNQEFKITDNNAVFPQAFVMIVPSSENARLAAERQEPGGANVNQQNAPQRAIVVFAAGDGMPETRVPMVKESLGKWKIDAPDNYSAQQYHDYLLKELTAADEQKAQWPADHDAAYRNVAHHVIIAVMGGDQAQQGNQTERPMPGGGARPSDRDNPSPFPDRTQPNQPAPVPNPNP
jgi:hypothetical protein